MTHIQQLVGFYINAHQPDYPVLTSNSDREDTSYCISQKDFDENLPLESRNYLENFTSESNPKSQTSASSNISEQKKGSIKRLLLKASRNKIMGIRENSQEKQPINAMPSIVVVEPMGNERGNQRSPLRQLDGVLNSNCQTKQQVIDLKLMSQAGDVDSAINISQFSEVSRKDYDVNEKGSNVNGGANEGDITQDSIISMLKSMKLEKDGAQVNKSPEISPLRTPSKNNSVKQTPTSSAKKPRLRLKKPKAVEQLELDINLVEKQIHLRAADPLGTKINCRTPAFVDAKNNDDEHKFPMRDTSEDKGSLSPTLKTSPPIYLTWNEFISEIKVCGKPPASEIQKQIIPEEAVRANNKNKLKRDFLFQTEGDYDRNERPKERATSAEVVLIDNYVQIPLDVFRARYHEFVESRRNSFLKVPHSRTHSAATTIRGNHANGESDYSIVEFSVNRLPKDSTIGNPVMSPEQSSLVTSHVQVAEEHMTPKKERVSLKIDTDPNTDSCNEAKPPLIVTFRAFPENSSRNNLQKNEGDHPEYNHESSFASLVAERVYQTPGIEDKANSSKCSPPRELSEINTQIKLAERQIVSTLVKIYSCTEENQRSGYYDRLLENVSQSIINAGKICKNDNDLSTFPVELDSLKNMLAGLEKTEEESYQMAQKNPETHNCQADSLRSSLKEYLEEVIKLSKEKLARIEQQEHTVACFEAGKKDLPCQQKAEADKVQSQQVPQFTFSFAASVMDEEINRMNSLDTLTQTDELDCSIPEETLREIKSKLIGELKKSSAGNNDNIGYTSFFETDNSYNNSVELKATCVRDTEVSVPKKAGNPSKKKNHRVRFVQGDVISNEAREEKPENTVGLKKEFHELAVLEKLKLEKGHPARMVVISELIDEQTLQTLPKEQWRSYISQKYEALSVKA